MKRLRKEWSTVVIAAAVAMSAKVGGRYAGQ